MARPIPPSHHVTVHDPLHAILSGLAQGLAGWFEGASLSVDINRVTALAEERQMLWAMAASADFLDLAEKRQMVGLS